ncbi:MAG: hypothetical protein U5L45_09595 [Saprospiraceae bacterium]|nr:hypothetical protein [Saprospiraceae bacterium]
MSRGGSVFGLCPKNEPHSPFLRAKRAMGLSNYKFFIEWQMQQALLLS